MERVNQPTLHVGSLSGRRYIPHDRISGNERLVNDYFAENPVYPANIFRRRFRMNRPLFIRILNAIQQYDDYFIQKTDAVGFIGLSDIQKMTASIRMLAYGMPDVVDEYVRIGESTTIESLKKFCLAIIGDHGEEYLRSPTEADISRLLREGEKRGFPGILWSLDCMHWQWKNCPVAWHGQFIGHVHKPTIILEAVASYDLWIWHAYFGMPGSHNDINVLDRSHLFSDLTEGRAPQINFTINENQYTMGYYLADGIYPMWATIVQTISQPQEVMKQLFATMQESCRKDVERAFGVLQALFAIVKGPARLWSNEDLGYIMNTCIILHNMIIEDERDDSLDDEYETPKMLHPIEVSRDLIGQLFSRFIARHHEMRFATLHHKLHNDLIEHLWSRQGRLG